MASSIVSVDYLQETASAGPFRRETLLMPEQPSPYRTIKALVFGNVRRHRGRVDYKALTTEIRQCFPASKWNRSHWAWYRYQIVRGRFKNLFSEQERANLAQASKLTKGGLIDPLPVKTDDETAPRRKGRAPDDPEVKRIGDAILSHVRLVISLAAGQDANLQFKLNRWVFSRLQQEEIRAKRPIKRKLWERGMRACQACKQPFDSPKGMELHRKDSSLGYSLENCELLCRECHQQLE
jgi:hypothetical protein